MKDPNIVVECVMLADDPATFVTREVPSINVEIGGIPGDRHYGILRPADSRQNIYPRGTMIANRRQISIVSREECERIAERVGLPAIKPEWLGANIMVSGLEKPTELPAGARLRGAAQAGTVERHSVCGADGQDDYAGRPAAVERKREKRHSKRLVRSKKRCSRTFGRFIAAAVEAKAQSRFYLEL